MVIDFQQLTAPTGIGWLFNSERLLEGLMLLLIDFKRRAGFGRSRLSLSIKRWDTVGELVAQS